MNNERTSYPQRINTSNMDIIIKSFPFHMFLTFLFVVSIFSFCSHKTSTNNFNYNSLMWISIFNNSTNCEPIQIISTSSLSTSFPSISHSSILSSNFGFLLDPRTLLTFQLHLKFTFYQNSTQLKIIYSFVSIESKTAPWPFLVSAD